MNNIRRDGIRHAICASQRQLLQGRFFALPHNRRQASGRLKDEIYGSKIKLEKLSGKNIQSFLPLHGL
jgi:hypothetical protein